MSSATLYRLSGLSLILGSALLGLGSVIRIVAGKDDPANRLLAAGWLLQAAGALLVLLGLPGVYARQAPTAGTLGLVGLVCLTFFLLIFGTFSSLLHGLVLPTLPGAVRPRSVDLLMASGAFLGMTGGVTFGIATIRARVLPRGGGACMIVGSLTVFFGHNMPLHLEDVGLVVLTAGLAWLGWSVLSLNQRVPTLITQPA